VFCGAAHQGAPLPLLVDQPKLTPLSLDASIPASTFAISMEGWRLVGRRLEQRLDGGSTNSPLSPWPAGVGGVGRIVGLALLAGRREFGGVGALESDGDLFVGQSLAHGATVNSPLLCVLAGQSHC
jgi:hypothetical protein